MPRAQRSPGQLQWQLQLTAYPSLGKKEHEVTRWTKPTSVLTLYILFSLFFVSNKEGQIGRGAEWNDDLNECKVIRAFRVKEARRGQDQEFVVRQFFTGVLLQCPLSNFPLVQP
jgi:hypothetical protein